MGGLVPPEELERRRALRRIAEFDTTIEIWDRKRNDAATQIAIATGAKLRFISSLDPALKLVMFTPR